MSSCAFNQSRTSHAAKLEHFLLSLFLQHDIQTHKQTNAQTNKQPNSKTNWTNSTNTFERETKKEKHSSHQRKQTLERQTDNGTNKRKPRKEIELRKISI